VAKAVRHGAARLHPGHRRPPDYLVIGVKRGGTTSLQRYLAQHPQVMEPHTAKASHYFDVAHGKSWSWYLSHFPTDGAREKRSAKAGGAVVVGEASPYYSFHPLALERIAAVMPDVKLVMALRDPVDRAWSHYAYEVARGFETLPFAEALDAEPNRLAGVEERMRRDPALEDAHHRHHSYQARGRYAEQIERVRALFPAEQLHLVVSEELFGAPSATLGAVFRFLGLPPIDEGRYTVQNANEYAELEPELRDRLALYYAEPNEQLYRLLGRRLSWTTPRDASRV
jgi:hypothetical protein